MLETLSKQEKRIILLASFGGALEFYDFLTYVFVADIIGQVFFPTHDQFLSKAASLSVFALSYLVRPLGGIVFSHFGDTFGRKETFIVSLLMMALPTFLIGFLPTYSSIGIFAPILLIIFRLSQGMAVGGEIPGAITYCYEQVNQRHRGFACAFIYGFMGVGIVFGQVVMIGLHKFLSSSQMLSWGWRIPFLLGGVLGILGLYLRRRMTETPAFQQYLAEQKSYAFPLKVILRDYRKQILRGIALVSLIAVTVYVLLIFMPDYLGNARFFHYSHARVEQLNMMNSILNTILLISFGLCVDKYGAKKIYIIGAVSFVIFSYWIYILLASNVMTNLIVAMIGYSIIIALIAAAEPFMIADLFPTPVRYTGVAMCYNIGIAFFGGTAPLLVNLLVKTTHSSLMPAFYIMFIALLALAGAKGFQASLNPFAKLSKAGPSTR